MTDRLSNDFADQIARLKQERDEQAQRIAELELAERMNHRAIELAVETIDALNARIAELEAANTTRPDYNLRCTTRNDHETDH